MDTREDNNYKLPWLQFMVLGFFVIMVTSSCTINRSLSRKNLQIYKPNFRVHYRVTHPDTLSSQFALRITATKYRLTLKAYDSYRGKVVFFDQSWEMSGTLGDLEVIKIPVKAPRYVLEVILTNLNNNELYHDITMVDKRNECNRITLLDRQKEVIVKNFVELGEEINFKYADPSVEHIFVKQFTSNFKPAPPPQSSRELSFNPRKKPKKQFTLSKGTPFIIDETGLYFVQVDTLSKEGIYLNCFDNTNFPDLTDVNTLIQSIRYITRNEEYQRLLKSRDKKGELDKFWLERGGTKDRARALISIYYNRVQASNEYFTTYKEGWKTDRGIIYTIYGPPNRVQQSADYEVWYYRNPNYNSDTELTFKKGNGQYILRRASHLEYSWKASIYQWRKGLVR